MNKQKRELLKDACSLLERSADIIQQVLELEQDCLDNIPENLQTSNNYERIEDAIDTLEASLERIDEAKCDILDASV